MRKALCILVCIAICLSLGGCYDSNEISRLAFIIAIGIDKAEGDLYEYTFQAVNPSAFESGESSDEPIVSTVISASTIYAAMEKLNSKISEKCDYSHIKLAVFSQELMKRDSENILPSMLKSDSFHPNTRVAVSTGRASEYLKSIKIPLDTNPAEYYENIFNQKYSPYTPDTRLRDLEKSYKNHAQCNVLPIVKASKSTDDESTLKSYNTEQFAIVKDYKLIGTADQNEAFCYNLITGKDFKNNFYIKIPETKNNVAAQLTRTSNRIKVDLSGENPVITLNVRLDGSILWSESDGKYIAENDKFNKAVQDKVERQLTEFLYKCSQEYKADICDFAKRAKKNYLTVNTWENEDWQGLFEKTEYKVNAKITLRREGINIK